MISDQSIQEVRDRIDIVKVAEQYIKLKKQGSTYSAPCPFHNESTPSFKINPVKQIYKCFGCGVGGDAIKLVMEIDHTDYISAIRRLADIFQVTLTETETRQEDKEIAEKKLSFYDLNKGAAKKWQAELLGLKEKSPEAWPVLELEKNRCLTMDSLIDFQIGFAPDDYNFISKRLVETGYYGPAEEIGLIRKQKDGEKIYDTFRNRIIFPIQDERGQIVGFGGRKPEDGNDENPKYLNSKASIIYRKESVLYGLYQAQQEIRKQQTAIIVEGYFDVIAMHQAGICNVIAPCGTALTESHAQKLKKLCNTVILLGDGDKAGKKANLKAIDVLVLAGLKVEVCELPEGEDPDSFTRTFQEGVKA